MNTNIHYAGMDIHASNTVIQTIDPQGKLVVERELPTEANELINWARSYPHGQLQVILEQGTHARWVANALNQWVDRLVICDPLQNSLVHQSGDKNDRSDAQKLARLLRLEEFKPVWWQPMQQRHVFKSMIKMYLRQKKSKTAGIQRLTHFLRHLGVRIPSTESRFSFRRADQWIQQVALEDHRRLARQKLEVIRYHHQRALELFKDIRRHGQKYWEIAEFTKIPGVGPLGAHLFSALIEDPKRFKHRSQVYKFCQLAVISRSSSGKQIGRKCLNKRGYGELKAMSHRAWLKAAHAEADNEIKRFWQASCRRASSERNARLNTQRKIINVMWSLWRNGWKYDPQQF